MAPIRHPLLVVATLLWASCASGTRAADWIVDGSKPAGRVRALHGVNNGPLDCGGTIDLSAYLRELAIPGARLHDAHWPNPDVVDVHAVFPDPSADPDSPAGYDFTRTDEYVGAIRGVGSHVVYRLGESIEHGKDKRRVAPPADPARWARVCVGIIRHYNEGWAGGFRHGIRRWEIWNEPDNRPNMWTGGDEAYFRLYAAAAGAIKRRWPDLEVGGPAVGNVGAPRAGAAGGFDPSPFAGRFLDFCRKESAPLDFFSWHCYAPDVPAFTSRARGVRDLLDRQGFAKTQSFLDEWNYLPDDNWAPVLPAGQGEAREKCFERIGGAEGAAFACRALVALQDAPVDEAYYYAGDTNPFGLFTRHGVPRKNFYAFKAFKLLLDTPRRLPVAGGDPAPVGVLAGVSEDGATLRLLAAGAAPPGGLLAVTFKQLPWEGPADVEVRLLDAAHNFEPVRRERAPGGEVRVVQACQGPTVWVVSLRKIKTQP